MKTTYDIVIVGGGLVGNSLALALPEQLRIAILDTQLPDFSDEPLPSRPLSLSYGSVRTLEKLNIWPTLQAHAHPIMRVHVSQQGQFGNTLFTAEQQQLPALGYVLPFAYLQRALQQQANARANVSFHHIDALNALQTESDNRHVSITCNGKQQTLDTSLIVGADGTQSTVRQLLGLNTQETDHHEWAITATLKLNQAYDGTAYERFTNEGTLAILPLADNTQCRFVWTLAEDLKNKVMQWDKSSLLNFINDAFQGYLCAVTECTWTGGFPLKTLLTTKQIHPGAVIIGNAAHTLYPIAAQGFNLGLRDAICLSRLIQQQRYPLHDFQLLQDYQQQSQQYQKTIINTTRGISAVFNCQLPLAGKFSSLGLLALDMLQPLKNRFSKKLSGVS